MDGWILYTAGAFDWRVKGVYSSPEKLLEHIKEYFGDDEIIDMETVMSHDWQSENEMKIEKTTIE